jgi:hypothetical protein
VGAGVAVADVEADDGVAEPDGALDLRPNTGQILLKYWSNYGQMRGECGGR